MKAAWCNGTDDNIWAPRIDHDVEGCRGGGWAGWGVGRRVIRPVGHGRQGAAHDLSTTWATSARPCDSHSLRVTGVNYQDCEYNTNNSSRGQHLTTLRKFFNTKITLTLKLNAYMLLLGVHADAERVDRFAPGFHGDTADVGGRVPVKWPGASGGPREPEAYTRVFARKGPYPVRMPP